MAEQRRVVGHKPPQRRSERQQVSVAARLTWKDAAGAVRFVSVATRDISEVGAFVECEGGSAIPLYRLVHLQIERAAHGAALPSKLCEGRVLSAVWRVGPWRRTTGTPSGYALRFLVAEAPAAVVPFAGPSHGAIGVAS